MDSLLKLTFVAVLLSVSTVRAAEPPSVDQVRAELERQMREMVDSPPPPEVQLLFVGLDPEKYKLAEVHFTLDGQPLNVPSVDVIGSPGPHVLASLKVADGPHTLVSNVIYMDAEWSLFSETSGFLWNMTSTLNFQAQRGLRVQVKAISILVPDEKDARRRIKLSHGVAAEMTAKLADVATHEPPKTEPPKTASNSEPPKTEPPKTEPKPEPAPQPAPVPQKARLLVRALMNRKPVEATLFVRGAISRQVLLKKQDRKPAEVEVPPGTYSVDLIARGFLAQTRRVELSGSTEQALDFSLVRAPKKQLVKDKGDRLELQQPLSFLAGQATLKPGGAGLVQQLVDALVRNPIRRLRIEGHTDNTEGAEGSRQQLSEARARAVAELLVSAGVEPARLESVGFGDTRPKAPNITPRGRELNRRVELIVLER